MLSLKILQKVKLHVKNIWYLFFKTETYSKSHGLLPSYHIKLLGIQFLKKRSLRWSVLNSSTDRFQPHSPAVHMMTWLRVEVVSLWEQISLLAPFFSRNVCNEAYVYKRHFEHNLISFECVSLCMIFGRSRFQSVYLKLRWNVNSPPTKWRENQIE